MLGKCISNNMKTNLSEGDQKVSVIDHWKAMQKVFQSIRHSHSARRMQLSEDFGEYSSRLSTSSVQKFII